MNLNVSLCVDINPARNHLLTHLAVDLLEGGKAEVPVLGLDERLRIVGGHEELQQLRLTQSVLGARDVGGQIAHRLPSVVPFQLVELLLHIQGKANIPRNDHIILL